VTDEAPVFTARMAAAMRASHLLVDDPPPIFRDDYALALSEIAADDAIALARGFDPSVGAVFRAAALVRARFTDEQVEEAADRGVGQYVILGAGLDSFSWRRPELAARLQVFEVDHPGTQAYKRVRLAAVGLSDPPGLHFVPVDFTSGIDLGPMLSEAGFRSDRPAVWSWLGVMVYLTRDRICATLRRLCELSAPGSVLVADFLLARSLMDDAARAADDIGRRAAAEEGGEPYATRFDTGRVADLVTKCGWRDCRTWVPYDFAPWFAGRTDSLRPSTFVGLLTAHCP
jgi:methyltransferase (TIGR00027 family)